MSLCCLGSKLTTYPLRLIRNAKRPPNIYLVQSVYVYIYLSIYLFSVCLFLFHPLGRGERGIRNDIGIMRGTVLDIIWDQVYIMAIQPW